jgi:putative Mg2+ transporter-C (MgtC) family protein
MSDLTVIGRLALSTLIAGIIGYERERHGRAAGFRTHILVALGSCLAMLTGLYLAEQGGGTDPTRMGAQVISGIGFLGAGTILRYGTSVRGLTTAASLWAVGGIGLAVGSGFLVGSLAAGAIVILALFVLSGFEQAMRKETAGLLIVETHSGGEALARIRSRLGMHHLEVRDVNIAAGQRPDQVRLEFHVQVPSEESREEIIEDLRRSAGAVDARWA